MVIRVADQVFYLSPFVAALKMIQKAFSCGCCCCCFEKTVHVFVKIVEVNLRLSFRIVQWTSFLLFAPSLLDAFYCSNVIAEMYSYRSHLDLMITIFSMSLRFGDKLNSNCGCENGGKKYFTTNFLPYTFIVDKVFLTFMYGWFSLQTRPVPFKVRAVVTSSDIEFNMQDIDFGFCTVYESVRRTVTITNKSVLPQPFGFCGVPDVSEITFQEWDCFVPRTVIHIPESRKFFSWRGIPESRVVESRIPLKESGI